MAVPGPEIKFSEGRHYGGQLHFAHDGEEMSRIQAGLFKDGGGVSKTWFDMMKHRSGSRTQDTIAKERMSRAAICCMALPWEQIEPHKAIH